MAGITVQEAKPEHYEEILSLIQKYLDSEGGWERNKNLLEYKWDSMPNWEGTTPGYVLLTKEEHVVGYVGYIMSQREFDGQLVLCNSGSTLVVAPEYTMYMLKLLEPYLRKDTLRIAYNPRQNVEKLYTNRFFGLVPFLEYTRFFPGMGILLKKDIYISDDINDAYANANERESLLISDNCKYVAETITVYTKEGNFNIIGRKFRLRNEGFLNIKLSFFEVLYVSNKALFGKYLRQIIKLTCKKKRTQFFVCDDRYFYSDNIPFNIKKEFKCFCSQVEGTIINHKDLDDLYSEKTLLNFYDPPKPIKITLKRIINKKDFLEI